MLSNEQINDIRGSVNIVDIISSYIPLTKKGKNYFGACPFHPDSDPSFCVSEQKQIYTCFSCKASGNVIHFVMNYENVSFKEAIKIIACLIFIFFAFFNAMEYMSDKDKKEEDKKMKIFSSGILTVALAIFIGEMGDKTNLSTVALTTQFENGYIYILLGATFAMVASNVLSIFIGSIIQNRLSPKGLSILSTMLFLVFGIIGLSAIINQYMQNFTVTIMFAITLFLICSIICKKIYSNSK